MKKTTILFLIAAFAVGLTAAFFFLRQPERQAPPPVPASGVVPTSPTVERTGPVVRLPAAPAPDEAVDSQAAPELPLLEKSDAAMREALSTILPEKKWLEMFIFDHLIRRFVLMVDSLPRPDLSYRRLPLCQPVKRFIPAEQGGALTISPENYQRYATFVKLVETVEMKDAADVYHRHYSLFEEAYLELGYSEGGFNHRLIEVVDHLLITPEVNYPVRLVQPHIRYQYADPQLEALSTGQKLLIRMGPENSGIILSKLRELRPLLVNSAQASH